MPISSILFDGGRAKSYSANRAASRRRQAASYKAVAARRRAREPIRHTVGLQGANIPEGLGLHPNAPPYYQQPWQAIPEGYGLSSASPWVQQTKALMDVRNQLLQAPPTVGAGGGGGGGGGVAEAALQPLHEIRWKPATWETPGGRPPSWWVNQQPENATDAERPDVAYLMHLNSLIPFMSPEDQRRAAATLYATNADAFSFYKPDKIGVDVPVGQEILEQTGQALPTIDESYFQSSQRAQDAIQALSNMREATVGGNRWKFGPGYTWLQQVLGAASGFGGGNGRQTRAQQLAMAGQLDPLLAQGQSQDIGPFAAIGQMLSQPFFSRGRLTSPMRTQTGGLVPFSPNPQLFG